MKSYLMMGLGLAVTILRPHPEPHCHRQYPLLVGDVSVPLSEVPPSWPAPGVADLPDASFETSVLCSPS